MVTCYLTYRIDPYQQEAFETYAKMWIPLVNKYGGNHHGYFLPHEGANDVAVALFSFESLAAYEIYREKIITDPDCQAAFRHAEETKCIISYNRSFMKPVLT
ncbi:MAG: NIPSNAP family protein [Desulfobulbaceae bacterium]|nr:MAG: NIPSNAP family protein [Desulfobulbaceae bacterium]